MKLSLKFIFPYLLILGSLIFVFLAFRYFYFYQPPRLKNLAVNLTDLSFDMQAVSEYGPILPFGGELVSPNGDRQLSPTIEFYLHSQALIKSPVDGIITDLGYQPEDKDYYAWIKPNSFSPWIIEIDHITNPKIAIGDKVTAGHIIGQAGHWEPSLNVGRTELMIVKRHWSNRQSYYCPLAFLENPQSWVKKVQLILQKSHFSSKSDLAHPFCLYSQLKDKDNTHQYLQVVK